MNFLYPLFLAGIAAVGLPIVLHMIRRHTRKRVTFSSLMFLRTTVPRFKNRSRLENLPLLILRCIVLCLFAFGFARPFFPRQTADNPVRLGRRIVVLVDTSASMRRAGMWSQAIREAQSVLKGVNQADRVCVMSFDQNTQTLIGFEQWGALGPAQRVSTATEHISKLSPGWALTNLGQALVGAAEAIEDDEVNDGQQPIGTRHIVLISDLQQGSNIEALRAYEWPRDIELVVKPIRCHGTTNAALQLVTNRNRLVRPGSDELPHIRITNSPDATEERFGLSWADTDPEVALSPTVDVYVPAGHSAVVRAPARDDGATSGKLVLTGDDHGFDNALYLAPHLKQQADILYIGSDDADDRKGTLYYVRRAFGATRSLDPQIICRPADGITDTDVATAHLIIVADSIEPERLVSLRPYLESGGTIFLVMKSPDAAETLAGLAGIESIESEEADVEKYAMLTQIEFKHPLLAPFSEPRFGDFTQIHFWKHRRINITNLPDARVLAWFDSNYPALIESNVGKGFLLVLTSGWHPADSQLALSSKFVPLLYSVLEYAGFLTGQQPQYFVSDHVPIPRSTKSEPANLQLRTPDNSLIGLDADRQTFTQTHLPGIYAIESTAENQLFAVNLPAAECQTAAMPIENLERFGISLERSSGVAAVRTERARRHRSFAGLENEQKVWRWVFVVLLAVSLIEIGLAGLLTRPLSVSEGEQK
jgi:hypothetical protein